MSKYYSSSIAFGANQTKTEQVVVSPTKIGSVTTDSVSGALTVDEVPTLDSLNPVSSDGVARAVIQAGAELPTRGSSDTGKVLTVANSDGDLEWDEPADGLPDMTGHAGKLLGAVNNGGTMEAQWVNAPESYPSVADNAGKVLKVNAGATGVEWATDNTVTVDQNYNASSTNAQSGTAVAGAISGISQVPSTAAADANKVLTVNSQGNGFAWADTQLPTEKTLVAGSNVTITEGTTDVTIAATDTTYTFSTGLTESSGTVTVTNPLPASTSADENKVLSVNAQGAAVWANASGGDVVVIPLTATPTGAALETLFGQVDAAVTANKLVVIKTTNSGNKVRHFVLTNTNYLTAYGKFYHLNCIEMVENLPDMDAIDHWMVISYNDVGDDPQYGFTVYDYTIATGMTGSSFNPFSA